MIKCKDCRYIREFNERRNQWCCSISRPLRCVNANKPKLCMYFRKKIINTTNNLKGNTKW